MPSSPCPPSRNPCEAASAGSSASSPSRSYPQNATPRTVVQNSKPDCPGGERRVDGLTSQVISSTPIASSYNPANTRGLRELLMCRGSFIGRRCATCHRAHSSSGGPACAKIERLQRHRCRKAAAWLDVTIREPHLVGGVW